MPISVHCPQCGKKLNAPDSAAGKRARCPQCKTILTLPAADVPMADEVLDAEPMQPPPSGLGVSDPGDAPGDEYGLAPDPTEQLQAPPPLPTSPVVGEGGGGEGGPARRPCPMCGEMIPVSAVQCRFCHEIFDPAMKKAAMKKAKKDKFYGGEDEDLSGGEWVVAIICSGIGCIMGIIWMIQGKPKGKKMFGISIAASIFWSVVRGIIEGLARN
jgi:hypothetical protein